MTHHPPRRGFALIIVLWAVVALALGGAILTANARRSIAEADATGASAGASAALDSAVQETIFHLLADGQAHWPPGGTRSLRVGDRGVTVSIVDQAGSVNPNTASPALLAALLVALGTSNGEAAALAEAIVEWRFDSGVRQQNDAATRYRNAGLTYAPPASAFQSIGELGLVLGMTPAILARLRPYLSLWSAGDPDPALAGPPVLAALRTLPAGLGRPGSSGTGITVVALTCRIESGPGRAVRRVVVQLVPTAPRPFHIVESIDESE